MIPYHYKRSTRSWVNYTFFLAGAVCLTFAYLQSQLHWFGKSPEPGFSLLLLGTLLFIGGAAGLLVRTEWEMQIDEHHLSWKDGKHCGEIPIEQIKTVRVEEGDGRCMTVETISGTQHTISGECYGDSTDLRSWLRNQLGKKIELLD